MSSAGTTALAKTDVRHDDRRAHRRISSTYLPGAGIRIPHRPAVSLVDLSSGGALLELPFQAQPETRFQIELVTPRGQMVVPFQLLRCYVAGLRDRVIYHAAGAFDQLLNLPPSMGGAAAAFATQRLIDTLERFLHTGRQADPRSRASGEFHELLAWAIGGLRRGDSPEIVALKIKSHLTQRFPSLVIYPTTSAPSNALTSAQFFGVTFRSRFVLSAEDRRFLRSAAQLISMTDECARELGDDGGPEVEEYSPLVTYSAAEWLVSKMQSERVNARGRTFATSRRSPDPVPPTFGGAPHSSGTAQHWRG